MALAISESTGSIASVRQGRGERHLESYEENYCVTLSAFLQLQVCTNVGTFLHTSVADQNLKMHQALMVADSEVAEEEGGEEVEALVETGVVLVVEGEGVEDSEVEGVGIEEEEVVDLLEVDAEEIGADVDLVEEEADDRGGFGGARGGDRGGYGGGRGGGGGGPMMRGGRGVNRSRPYYSTGMSAYPPPSSG